MNRTVASVAIENTVYHFDKPFSYLVPEDKFEVQAGMRVLVPFGRGNSRRQGVVLSVESRDTDAQNLKEIIASLDHEPVLNDEMIKLAEFMKSRCFCTYYDAIRAILPTGINYQLSFEYSVTEDLGDRVFDLPDEQRRIISYILSKNNKAEQEKLLSEFGLSDTRLLDEMRAEGLLQKADSVSRRLGDKTVRMVRLSEDAQEKAENVKLSEKQQNVLDTLYSVGAASVKELCYYTGVTASVVDALVKKDLAVYFDDEVFRIPKTAMAQKKEIILTDDQNKALTELNDLLHCDSPEVSLLFGVTGSGKTSVFFKLIENAIEEDKDVIVMVPEIALTPQLISLFKAHFDDKVAVFHSALSLVSFPGIGVDEITTTSFISSLTSRCSPNAIR